MSGVGGSTLIFDFGLEKNTAEADVNVDVYTYISSAKKDTVSFLSHWFLYH